MRASDSFSAATARNQHAPIRLLVTRNAGNGKVLFKGTDAVNSASSGRRRHHPPRNLTAPTFNALGQATVSFGRNPSAQPGTLWKLHRTTDLLGYTESYRFDGTHFFDPAQFSVSCCGRYSARRRAARSLPLSVKPGRLPTATDKLCRPG